MTVVAAEILQCTEHLLRGWERVFREMLRIELLVRRLSSKRLILTLLLRVQSPNELARQQSMVGWLAISPWLFPLDRLLHKVPEPARPQLSSMSPIFQRLKRRRLRAVVASMWRKCLRKWKIEPPARIGHARALVISTIKVVQPIDVSNICSAGIAPPLWVNLFWLVSLCFSVFG